MKQRGFPTLMEKLSWRRILHRRGHYCNIMAYSLTSQATESKSLDYNVLQFASLTFNVIKCNDVKQLVKRELTY